MITFSLKSVIYLDILAMMALLDESEVRYTQERTSDMWKNVAIQCL